MHSRPLCSLAMSGQSHLGNLVKQSNINCRTSQGVWYASRCGSPRGVTEAICPTGSWQHPARCLSSYHKASCNLPAPAFPDHWGGHSAVPHDNPLCTPNNRTKTVYPLCLFLVVKSFNINRLYILEQFYGHTNSTHFLMPLAYCIKSRVTMNSRRWKKVLPDRYQIRKWYISESDIKPLNRRQWVK